MDAHRVLIFDSSTRSDPALGKALSALGYKVLGCDDPVQAAALFSVAQADVALIYLREGDASLGLVEQLRATCPAAPVLIATAADAVELRIDGLQRGACDYLIPPFAPEYLRIRMTTATKRNALASLPLLRCGGVILDVDSGRIGDGSRWTRLTPTERQALSLLFEYGDRPVPKYHIKRALAAGDEMSDNAIEVVIYRLRAKAREWGMRIRTCRGLGYVLEHK